MPAPAGLCRAVLLALALAAGLPAAAASDPITAAEKQVFSLPHLANLPGSATLRYGYRKIEAGQAAVEDEAVLSIHEEAGRGRVVQADYLHGERHLTLPEVDQAVSNPIVLYFLESDVRGMRQRLGGQENYFRRRLRLALAGEASLRPVDVNYGGKTVSGTEVTVQPFVGDPLQERFKGQSGKSYRFILSPQVPGGVYQLRTVVDDPAGSGRPLVEEVLTLRDEKPAAR